MTFDAVDAAGGPSAYQASLLGWLGDRDPAESQAGTAAALRRLAAEAGPHLRRRPAEGEWSVLEVIGHLADTELVMGGRYRWIVAHDRPPLMPYDQELWAARLRYNEADPEDVLASFEAMRAANLALWHRMPVTDRARTGLHAERGPESWEMTFRMTAGHDLLHLDQVLQTLAAVRGIAATEVR
jgi:hypothetical protein